LQPIEELRWKIAWKKEEPYAVRNGGFDRDHGIRLVKCRMGCEQNAWYQTETCRPKF